MTQEKQNLVPQALSDYYRRIGAEILNFRRAIVKVHHGQYYTERCLIKVNDKGEVSVSHDTETFNPTEEEQTDIKSQWRGFKRPEQIEAEEAGARRLVDKLEGEKPDSQAHVFYSRVTGKVIMVQHRFWDDNAARQFVPYTFWDDGEWRKMEPDGKLPFWKPAKAREARIMIHEGSKAAMAAEKIATDPNSDHPWKEYLSKFEHWGMIGGALAPHRTNFEELRRERPEEVVYVCDNDRPGVEALQKVSKFYKRNMKGVRFDGRWPQGWDVADPLPETFWNSKGEFIGPQMEEMLKPATYATEYVPTGGQGRPQIVVTTDFATEWFHSVIPEVYVHKDWPNDIKTREQFNSLIAPYSDAPDTASRLQKSDASKAVNLTYDPSILPGIYNDDMGGGLCLNTHTPSKIKSRQGDISPFLEFMEHLIPHADDRGEMLRWIITIIARPDLKIGYGCLLISEPQGVGKSTLGEKILAPLVGKHNTSFPTEKEVVDSEFNYWAGHKRLAVVHEIYAGHSSAAYDDLKGIIVDGTININQKYMAPYKVDNWLHIFACSNSLAALKLPDEDRRWLVPKVTTKLKPKSWWAWFNNWLTTEEGLRIIKGWCEEQAKNLEMIIMKGEIAPMTSAKKEVVQEGYSDGMKLAYALFVLLKEEADQNDKTTVLLDNDVRKMIREIIYQDRPNQYLEKQLTIRKVAKAAGWVIGDKKINLSYWNGRHVLGSRPMFAGSDAIMIAEIPFQELFERMIPTDPILSAREKGLLTM